MFDRLHAMRVFVRIVETRSFTRAAELLDIPRATATTIVQTLEASLRTTLLVRTTRRIDVTQAGTEYYERCLSILGDVDEIEGRLRQADSVPGGALHVAVPMCLADGLVCPNLDHFLSRFPDIDLSMRVVHTQSGEVANELDCSLLVGEAPYPGTVARRLGTLSFATFASPAYLGRHGLPTRLDDLSRHVAANCMAPSARKPLDFEFRADGARRTVRLRGPTFSDEHACIVSALHGAGMIQQPAIAVAGHLRAGALM